MYHHISYLVSMYEHHERVPLTRHVLLTLQILCYQLWCIRNQEIKVSEIRIHQKSYFCHIYKSVDIVKIKQALC